MNVGFNKMYVSDIHFREYIWAKHSFSKREKMQTKDIFISWSAYFSFQTMKYFVEPNM